MYKQLISLCLVVFLSGCPTTGVKPPTPVFPQEISLVKNPNTNLKVNNVVLPFATKGVPIEIEREKQNTIDVKVFLSDGSVENDVEWFYSDNSIAKIDEGFKIKPLKAGVTNVKAVSKRDNSKFAEFKLITYINNSSPKISPDNKKIALISNKNGYRGIYIMNLDGSEEQQLTNTKDNLGYTESFEWSPQGDKIIFSTNNNSIGICDINNLEINIILKGNSASKFNWSPDGKKIAFNSNIQTSSNHINNTLIINSDGTNLKTIISEDTTYKPPLLNWSPDSKYLGFIFKNNLNIYNTERDNKKFINTARNFSWLADSKNIIFTETIPELPMQTNLPDEGTDIFKINIENNNKETVIKGKGINYTDFTISPDKLKIAMLGSKRVSTFTTEYLQDIYTLSSDDLNFKNITNNKTSTFEFPPLPGADQKSMILVYPQTVYSQILDMSYSNTNLKWLNDNTSIMTNAKTNIQSNGLGIEKLHIISTNSKPVKEYSLPSDYSNYILSITSDGENVYFSSLGDINENQDKVRISEIYSISHNSEPVKLTKDNEKNNILFNRLISN